ncbi:hypothetical protein EJ02DRAFT_477796 [Clathrospora elynae]|uniref:Uncharacterized protein n=1 Tax=Clathrospora elynae TaxID=706981 RepID=A0A6A5SAR1_9PLEO|nr:hypothetical protein EJ02DRAFT_477796 [Clathrospora elynae]
MFDEQEYTRQDYKDSSTRLIDRMEDQWNQCWTYLKKDRYRAYATVSVATLYTFFDWLLSQRQGKGGRKLQGTKLASSLGTYWKVFRLVWEDESEHAQGTKSWPSSCGLTSVKEKPSSLCGSLWAYTAFYESDRFDQEMLHDTVCKTGLPFAEVVYPAWVVHHSLGDGPAELLRQLLTLKLYAKRPGYTWEQYCDALEASRDDFEKARKSLELKSPDRTPSLSPNITLRMQEAGPVDRMASLYSGLEDSSLEVSVEFEV